MPTGCSFCKGYYPQERQEELLDPLKDSSLLYGDCENGME